jgi:hypothetical protein
MEIPGEIWFPRIPMIFLEIPMIPTAIQAIPEKLANLLNCIRVQKIYSRKKSIIVCVDKFSIEIQIEIDRKVEIDFLGFPEIPPRILGEPQEINRRIPSKIPRIFQIIFLLAHQYQGNFFIEKFPIWRIFFDFIFSGFFLRNFWGIFWGDSGVMEFEGELELLARIFGGFSDRFPKKLF